jgi:hypothetical protein
MKHSKDTGEVYERKWDTQFSVHTDIESVKEARQGWQASSEKASDNAQVVDRHQYASNGRLDKNKQDIMTP